MKWVASRPGEPMHGAPERRVPGEHTLLAPLLLIVIVALLVGGLTTAVIVASLAVGTGWLAGSGATARARR
ncbi:hypothetical protein [Pseudonocardia sp. MH-G8]|uniref:hypothetical protein n=1 Tax=Pseudonocardia sp. MH-G8 TaxID=1854588 RepID=UPI000BA12F7B|nr:hypothetical protein [Pseudonocardia sp. MH-G8]OZM79454.1 hypothetical protein CFP66_25090 [Pseudonocardia sp. MH-G8]